MNGYVSIAGAMAYSSRGWIGWEWKSLGRIR